MSKISVAQGRGRWKCLEEARVQQWIYKVPSGTDNTTLSYLHMCYQRQSNSFFILCFAFFLARLSYGFFQRHHREHRSAGAAQRQSAGLSAAGREGVPWERSAPLGSTAPPRRPNSASVLWERVCSQAGAREGHPCKSLPLSPAA